MFLIQVHHGKDAKQLTHGTGPLEFGRGPDRGTPRFVLADPYVSRDQLRVESTADGRLRLENLSRKREIRVGADRILGVGQALEVEMPATLVVGNTALHFLPDDAPALDMESMMTLGVPATRVPRKEGPPRLIELGDAPRPEVLAYWVEQVLSLQQAGRSTADLLERSAQVIVGMVGLDEGMILLRRGNEWTEAARAPSGLQPSRFSRTLLDQMCVERRTYFQNMAAGHASPTASLEGIRAVVASPIFGVDGDAAGAVYGVRMKPVRGETGIRPLEAQMIQLLAGAIGTHLAREHALQTRLQFERFVSPEIAAELESNPHLLESRRQEVTLLASDLRGFTSLSERLPADVTSRVIQDVMNRLTERILEHGGAIVDFAGDGILAMWNAPSPQPDHVLRGCKAAIAMLAEMPRLNERWQAAIGSPLSIGIGVHVGEAMVGNTGSSQRLKYGPLGFAVNLASRIQGATKSLGVPLLVSEAVRTRIEGAMPAECVGTAPMAGVQQEVQLYRLTADGDPRDGPRSSVVET